MPNEHWKYGQYSPYSVVVHQKLIIYTFALLKLAYSSVTLTLYESTVL